MATVLITGGTGLIGSALTKALLNHSYNVIILSRQTSIREPRRNFAPPRPDADSPDSYQVGQPVTGNLSYAEWNLKDQTIDNDAIANTDYIIHLAGAGVADKRWTKKRKQEIVDSRVKSGELIIRSLKENNNKVKAILSSSGIGWYGPDPVIPNRNPFTENDPAGDDFLGQTCKMWEGSLGPVTTLAKRSVVFRTGIVLSTEGGAFKEFKKPVRFGVAAILGNGRQIISWIHIDDLVRLYIAAIENDNISGVYNAVAPNPASNKYFTVQLAKASKGKFFIPVYVPSFILKLVLGEMSVEVLKSATVSCKKILDTGFTFLYPSIDVALKDLK